MSYRDDILYILFDIKKKFLKKGLATIVNLFVDYLNGISIFFENFCRKRYLHLSENLNIMDFFIHVLTNPQKQVLLIYDFFDF